MMLKGAYDLLQAKQAEVAAERGYVDAWRDYWIARRELERALGGRLADEGHPAGACRFPRSADHRRDDEGPTMTRGATFRFGPSAGGAGSVERPIRGVAVAGPPARRPQFRAEARVAKGEGARTGDGRGQACCRTSRWSLPTGRHFPS